MTEPTGTTLPASGNPPSERWTAEQQLVHYVAERDVPCPVCGYNLRALTVPRCPECGRAVTLGIRLREPYLRAWIATAAAVFASAGMGIFLVPLLLIGDLSGGRPRLLVVIMTAWFIGSIPLCAIVLLARGPFLRLGRAVQWLLASFAVLAWLVLLILFCESTL